MEEAQGRKNETTTEESISKTVFFYFTLGRASINAMTSGEFFVQLWNAFGHGFSAAIHWFSPPCHVGIRTFRGLCSLLATHHFSDFGGRLVSSFNAFVSWLSPKTWHWEDAPKWLILRGAVIHMCTILYMLRSSWWMMIPIFVSWHYCVFLENWLMIGDIFMFPSLNIISGG